MDNPSYSPQAPQNSSGSLFGGSSGELFSSVPSYVMAADSHNIGASGGKTSWLEPETYVNALGNAGKFITVAAISGLDSFYRTGASVGNWMGGDFDERSTDTFIAGFDSDLSAYYRANKEAADLTGFIAGSLIPGLAGVKALNMGQKALAASKMGNIGGNMGKAMGLLVPKTEQFIAASAVEMNASIGAAKLLNANTVKAIGAGFWQNTLEAAAFEVFVQGSMAKSVTLDDQTLGDIVTNVAVGGVVGGAIFSAFGAASIVGRLKKAGGLEMEARMPFAQTPVYSGQTPAANKIISLAHDTEMSAQPFNIQYKDIKGNTITNNFAVNKELYVAHMASNNNEMRLAMQELAEGRDLELAGMLSDISSPRYDPLTGHTLSGQAQNTFDAFSGVQAIGRIHGTTRFERELAAKTKGAGGAAPFQTSVRFVGLSGENAGKLFDEVPAVLSLADTLPSVAAVMGKVKEAGFSTKVMWNALELTGKNAHLDAEARQIWATHVLQLDHIKTGTVLSEFDLPVLEKIFLEGGAANKFKDIKIIRGSGPTMEVFVPGSNAELGALLRENKTEVMNEVLRKMSLDGKIPVEQGTVAAAKIANVKLSYAEGSRDIANEAADLFAHQSTAAKYAEELRAKNLTSSSAQAADPLLLPNYSKLVYRIDKNMKELQPHIIDAMVYYEAEQALFVAGNKRVAAKILGPKSELLGDMSIQNMAKIDHMNAGAGNISSANANYGTMGSQMQMSGTLTKDLMDEGRVKLGETLQGPLTRLAAKPEAAIEFSGIDQKISRTGKLHVLYQGDEGNFMIPREAAEAIKKSDGELSLDDFMASAIRIENKETLEALESHIAVTGSRTADNSLIRAQQGFEDKRFTDVFRPIRRNLNDFKHYAFIRDPSVTGSNHMSMVHAASDKDLEALLSKVPPNYQKILRADEKAFFEAHGVYEYSRGLNENYINSDLVNKGVMSDFFPKTDPSRIVDDILQQHFRESDTQIREAVRLRYQDVFSGLEKLGDMYSRAETSQIGRSIESLKKTADNPYYNHIKTGLNISKLPENSLLYGMNKLVDDKFSQMHAAIKSTWAGVKTPEDLELINAALDKYAIKPAFYDAALQVHANHVAPKGELTKFVRKANGLLSMFTLGLDPTNSLVNAIGAQLLRNTEVMSLIRAIEAGDSEIAGQLGKINLPGTPTTMLSITKLTAKANKNFLEAQVRGPLMEEYKAAGIIKSRAEQLKMLVDDLSLQGTETVAELNGRMNRAFALAKNITDVGESASGNNLAEEYNRFISANIMDQITGVAIQKGLLTKDVAAAYRNTFVNRVEGNLVTSQRPLIFQGPIGQAVSLFQSYQFNLMQQLFRYTAEGTKKDLAMMAGLQSTLFGIQSLPAFHAMNVHVIGQLSGNKEHRDLYDATYGVAGKNAGDWILYGAPSNMLQANLYTRGDINPRTWTIIPTSLQETPIVAGWAKFFGNLWETVGKVSGKESPIWQSVLSGAEHNGISRPLAGFAQTLRGVSGPSVFSTDKSGGMLYSNDLVSWASMVRLAGARPLDEAVANDAMYRNKTYEAARKKDMQSLGENVKLTMYSGANPTDDQINYFAKKYVENGGKQMQFNKWMVGLYKDANVSQAEQLKNSLSNPFAYKMQAAMGGVEE